jgi:hypothetical protein
VLFSWQTPFWHVDGESAHVSEVVQHMLAGGTQLPELPTVAPGQQVLFGDSQVTEDWQVPANSSSARAQMPSSQFCGSSKSLH